MTKTGNHFSCISWYISWFPDKNMCAGYNIFNGESVKVGKGKTKTNLEETWAYEPSPENGHKSNLNPISAKSPIITDTIISEHLKTLEYKSTQLVCCHLKHQHFICSYINVYIYVYMFLYSCLYSCLLMSKLVLSRHVLLGWSTLLCAQYT